LRSAACRHRKQLRKNTARRFILVISRNRILHDRKDEGCSISYTTDAEKSTDTAVDFALLSALEPVTLLSIAIYDPRFVEIRIATRPSDSVSILRI